MVWAMDGFKSGGQGCIKNPYIDYNLIGLGIIQAVIKLLLIIQV